MVVEVEDTGSGIPAEQLPHIFTTTYRADPSRATTTGGAGLGLSLVKRIMERFGGSVSLSSREEEGTRVSLTFNIAAGGDHGAQHPGSRG